MKTDARTFFRVRNPQKKCTARGDKEQPNLGRRVRIEDDGASVLYVLYGTVLLYVASNA